MWAAIETKIAECEISNQDLKLIFSKLFRISPSNIYEVINKKKKPHNPMMQFVNVTSNSFK